MNPKKIVSKNLQYFLNKKGVTQTQMAHALSYPEMTVSNWIKAKTYPRVDKMQEMADYFNVKRSDIEEEKEEKVMFASTNYTYYNTNISAGLPINIDAITRCETISIPDAVMGKHAGNKNTFILRVNGDSMNKVIPDGSLIAVKPTPLETLKNGDMVVFSEEHKYSVKSYFKTSDTLIFKPNSTNNDHHDQIYKLDTDITIHGKVVLYIVELD